MGRRKSSRKAPTRKAAPKLEEIFTCPFCNHDKSCDVKIDRARDVGRITCRVCSETYTTETNYLSEPIDVYTDWIDACEEANDREASEASDGDDDLTAGYRP